MLSNDLNLTRTKDYPVIILLLKKDKYCAVYSLLRFTVLDSTDYHARARTRAPWKEARPW